MALPTLGVKDKDNADQTINTPNSGRQAAADSQAVAISTEDKTALDAAVTALQIVDDWDESDRAKVNLIAGQAGITGGSGTIAANTPRVTLATDSPGVTALGQTTKSASLPVTIASDQEVAHDAADSGNPTKVGGRATSTEPTAVASGDRANFYTDLTGRQVVAPYALPGLAVQGNPSVITGTSSTEVVAAQGAGVRFYMTSLLVTNADATVGTLVSITDGSGGTVLAQGYAAAAGGGFSITFPVPRRTTANTALHAVCGTTSAEVYVSAHGYSGV